MRMRKPVLLIVAVATAAAAGVRPDERGDAGSTRSPQSPPAEFVGSKHCRDCHQGFYGKWATSRHGLAMRPFTLDFAHEHLVPQTTDIEVRGRRYRVEIGGESGAVRQRGPDGEKTYPIAHVLGGKNVFYFLTPWHRGRWQVLPVAFDVRQERWYDMAGSGVRHFAEQPDEALDWTARQFTFNTSCYSCHVSQLSKDYSVETDTYHTVWGEPGINCDTCHGPGGDHVRTMVRHGDHPPDDLRIVRTGGFTVEQINSLCGPCHARMTPITAEFRPGAAYFDHYNLFTLEDRDFYPDGRDLGENYTYTLWRLSPCVTSGQLDCMHCHTSSGRNKHADDLADQACLPCHQQHVARPAAHSHHPAASLASRCVACHMPVTTFARMRRHDHSMLPPTPAATIAFGSPNACTISCHSDRDARWADQWVRKWYARDYQAPILHRAGLIAAARKHDWTKLPAMIAYLAQADRNEIYATSLIRLLREYRGAEKWPALLACGGDASPLVRAAAVAGLGTCPQPQARAALIAATNDASRLVRVSAALALSYHLPVASEVQSRASVRRAFAEYEAAMQCVPDDPAAHYNLGIYYHNRGNLKQAAAAYETSLRLEPINVPALVNTSMVYAALDEAGKAERALNRAIQLDPTSPAANFNLGLLLAEQGRTDLAEDCLRTALSTDPQFAEAAYNLGILLADTRLDETIIFCRKAAELRPDQARYAYTLALYLRQSGNLDAAADVLRRLLERQPNHVGAKALLVTIGRETAEPKARSREEAE